MIKKPFHIEEGAVLIAEERDRQVHVKGHDNEHDDKHGNGQLAIAAACYAVNSTSASCLHIGHVSSGMVVDAFPWDKKFDKRGKQTRIRELVKAGALIAAEIDRLQRLKKKR
jgi:hypothetical protein